MADIGQNFRTQIPDLSDPANIQEAFRLYHYGIAVEPDEANPINPNSIEAHLQALADSVTTGIVVNPLNDGVDLNETIISGFYYRGTTPETSRNYPALVAGLLTVTTSSTGVVFQSYRSIGGQLGTNKMYWRGRSATSTDWGSWVEASVVGHNHDNLYYTEAEIDAKINSANSQPANYNKVAIIDGTGKVSYLSSVSTSMLGYLSNLTGDIQSQLNDKASTVHYHDDRYYLRSEVSNPQTGAKKTVRVFVQESTPTGAVNGDLWFW